MFLRLLPTLLHRFAGCWRAWIGPFCVYSTAVGIQWMFWEDWIALSYASFLVQHHGDPEGLMRLAFVLLLDVVIVFSEIRYLVFCHRIRKTPGTL